MQEGQDQLALLYQNQAVTAARKTPDPWVQANALSIRSRLLLRLGRLEEAQQDLEEAQRIYEGDWDHKLKEKAQLDLSLAEAELDLELEPERAPIHFQKAWQIILESGEFLKAPQILLAYARVLMEIEDLEGAKEQLRTSINLVEERRGQVDADHRLTFFEQSGETFDFLTHLLLQEGDPEAFNIHEQKQARVLLDQVARLGLSLKPGEKAKIDQVTSQPRDYVAIQEELKPDTAIIKFAHVEGQLWAMVLTTHQLTPEPILLSRNDAQLYALVARFLSELDPTTRSSSLERQKAVGGEAFQTWFQPLMPHLSEAIQRLVFVPDGPLHQIPFAAMFNQNSGRFLVKDFILSIASSANLYCLAWERDSELRPLDLSPPLIIGDPYFDKNSFQYMDYLQAAGGEAKKLAALYKNYKPNLLLEKRATKRALLAHAPECGVFHFAGHALVNWKNPLLSHLPLASEPNPGGGSSPSAISAFELQRLNLSKTRMGVFSACNSGSGMNLGGEGVASLARSFLAAGVPAVVASLWPVDQGVPELMASFHRHWLEEGLDAAAAMQAAQLKLLESGEAKFRFPEVWAAFQVSGFASPPPRSK